MGGTWGIQTVVIWKKGGGEDDGLVNAFCK